MSAPVRTWRRSTRAAVRVAFGALAAAVTLALTVAIVALAEGEFPSPDTWSVLPVLLASAVGAVTWPGLRRWARRAADQLMHGTLRSPDDLVRSFGRRASRETPDSELLVQLAESLVRTLRCASAEMWRDDGSGRLMRVVSIPHGSPHTIDLDPAARRVLAGGGVVGRAWLEMWHPQLLEHRPLGEVRVAPATHAGELLGLVIVTRLASADRFGPDEDASLAELGSRLGVFLHNRALDATLQSTLEDLRRTNAELRASRVRLVSTADNERRRIERNLHDGAQQHLVALAVNLKLAADEIEADPQVAPSLFASLNEDVRDAINELRSLAHGIYPPLLMDAGLVEALRVSARRSSSPVALSIENVHRYPSEIEAAIYFCCMEALQNAAKHAPGAAVRLTVRGIDGALGFAVEDDGPGIGDDAVHHGHGLGNMVDRMVAVGGTLDVGRSASGGTLVTGSIPIAGDPGGDAANRGAMLGGRS